MKRLSILMTLVVFIGFAALAQQPHEHFRNVPLQISPEYQNLKTTKSKLRFNESRNQIDTFINITICDTFIWTPVVDFANPVDSGFLCGHNAFLDSSKAEQFIGVPGDQINGLWMWFGYARSTSSTQVIHVRVWDATGANGSPGNVIGTKDVTVQSIVPDVNNFDLTTVYFDSPITMPANGNFYAGFSMDYKKQQGKMKYDSNRAVAIFSWFPANSATFVLDTCSDDPEENTAWEQWHYSPSDPTNFDGAWHAFYDVNGFAERNLILPIVETIGCTAAITPSTSTICKGTTVPLTASGGTTYTWAPATGLDVTTGATVNAKPSVNTTYTVTANGGSCTATATITVNKKPVAKFTQGTCSGGHVLLTRTGTPTSGVTFKWFKNGVGISGATNSTYSATTTGNYKVKVVITATGCAKTSPEQTVTINCKTADPEMASFTADAYPNPFTKSLSVNISSASRDAATVQIMDFSGRTLSTFNNVDASIPFEINEDLTPGVYFIKVEQGSNEKMIKVVKSE